MEQNTFKRLEDGRIAVNGLVWGNDPAKAIDIKNELTGNKVHSIKLEETYYYPYSIYTPKTKK
jgi:hypothetical protein